MKMEEKLHLEDKIVIFDRGERMSNPKMEIYDAISNKLIMSPKIELEDPCWDINDIVYVNNIFYLGGGGQFSKIENGKHIEICNWLRPKYDTKAEGNTSLFDELFHGNIYDMSLAKNKKYIQFDNYNGDYYRDTKYDFINNIFYIKLLGNRKDNLGLKGFEVLRKKYSKAYQKDHESKSLEALKDVNGSINWINCELESTEALKEISKMEKKIKIYQKV